MGIESLKAPHPLHWYPPISWPMGSCMSKLWDTVHSCTVHAIRLFIVWHLRFWSPMLISSTGLVHSHHICHIRGNYSMDTNCIKSLIYSRTIFPSRCVHDVVYHSCTPWCDPIRSQYGMCKICTRDSYFCSTIPNRIFNRFLLCSWAYCCEHGPWLEVWKVLSLWFIMVV